MTSTAWTIFCFLIALSVIVLLPMRWFKIALVGLLLLTTFVLTEQRAPVPATPVVNKTKWPEEAEEERPQDTTDQKIALCADFRNRLLRTYSSIQSLGPEVELRVREHYLTSRPYPGLEPPKDRAIELNWEELLAWWNGIGHGYVLPLSSDRIAELGAQLEHHVAARNYLLEKLRLDNADHQRIRETLDQLDFMIDEIWVALGRDALKIPFDEESHRFQFTKPKDEDAPEMVLLRYLQLFSALTHKNWLDPSEKPKKS